MRRRVRRSIETPTPSRPQRELDDAGFPNDEFTDRWSRLHRSLRDSRFDAVLISSRANFEYVVGYRTPVWAITSRPLALILPLDRHPVLVVPPSHALEVSIRGLIRDIRPYRGFERDATDQLIAALREAGLTKGRIGVELGLEQRLGISVAELERIKKSLPNASFVDAAEVMWRVRRKKSEREIDCLRQAGAIAGEVLGSLLSDMGEGWSELQVYREASIRALRLGAEAPTYITMTAGPGGYDRQDSWPRQRTFARGELFWMDFAGTFNSYYFDYSRSAAIGRASRLQLDTYRRVHEMLDAALATVHAGVDVSEIVKAALGCAQQHGLNITMPSRMGHGLGLNLTEPPSLTGMAGEVLDAGEVIAVEPAVLTPHGWFHLEENILVRAGGYELLSAPMPRTLPIANAVKKVSQA